LYEKTEETVVVGRFVASLFLLLACFVGGFILAGLIVLLVTGSPGQAATIGAFCGFAAAFVVNFAIIMGRRTRGRDGDG